MKVDFSLIYISANLRLEKKIVPGEKYLRGIHYCSETARRKHEQDLPLRISDNMFYFDLIPVRRKGN